MTLKPYKYLFENNFKDNSKSSNNIYSLLVVNYVKNPSKIYITNWDILALFYKEIEWDYFYSLFYVIKYYFNILKFLIFNYAFNTLFCLFIVLFFDALFDGDEPIWEPLEWSLIQTWLLFILFFSWIAENLITSKYASFTGKDKRVWFAWYKSMWIIELFYIITLGITILLIITPFYFELTYASSYIMNFWNWFSKVFWFKFIALLSILIYINIFLQINIRFINVKKLLLFIFLNLIILNFLFFTQFYITFFSYLTDINWYVKTKSNSYIQLSHEPWKWGWDLENRDHFQYHITKTSFWFKNDGPFAESLFLINLYFFISLFIVVIFWLVFFKKTINTWDISYTYSLGAISCLRQFFYFYFLLILLIVSAIVIIYLKFPYEIYWLSTNSYWLNHFIF